MSRLPTDPVQRFWAKVHKSSAGCWHWVGYRNAGGYGYIRVRISGCWKYILAHRFSWSLHHGPIPAGQCVLHRCDVAWCVNPSHLFIGSLVDNVKDMVAKGRGARGEKNGRAKLTMEQVNAIRYLSSRGSQRQLARSYKVARKTIKGIIENRIWRFE